MATDPCDWAIMDVIREGEHDVIVDVEFAGVWQHGRVEGNFPFTNLLLLHVHDPVTDACQWMVQHVTEGHSFATPTFHLPS